MSNFENRVIELMTKDRLTIEQATKKAVDEQTRSRMEAHSVIQDGDIDRLIEGTQGRCASGNCHD